MQSILWINYALSALFLACYGYQFFYMLYALLHPGRTAPASHPLPLPKPSGRRYALLICARNEEDVIGGLLDSIRVQTYPQDLMEAFVAADNCTDLTAFVSRSHGARVFERFNQEKVGKGYALDFLLEHIWATRGKEAFDGYFILDADNLLAPDFVSRMDEVFAQGHRVVTGYRASRNYGDNWISAGYSLWFLRESRFLNGARMGLGTSCTVNGTGYLIHKDILLAQGGWKYYFLTEDAQFSAECILRGERIAYCPNGVFYDEQPQRFSQAWRQRLRWCKGYYQVLGRYGLRLFRGSLKPRNFACFDSIMTFLPAIFISIAGAALNGAAALVSFLQGGFGMGILLRSLLEGVWNVYLTLLCMGLVMTFAEWRRIQCGSGKKILYAFTFPLYTFTYLPICIAALFQRVTWKPIYHGEKAARPMKTLRLHFARIRGKI